MTKFLHFQQTSLNHKDNKQHTSNNALYIIIVMSKIDSFWPILDMNAYFSTSSNFRLKKIFHRNKINMKVSLQCKVTIYYKRLCVNNLKYYIPDIQLLHISTKNFQTAYTDLFLICNHEFEKYPEK